MRIAYVSADLGVPVFGRKGCSIHVQEVIGALLCGGAQVSLFTPRPEPFSATPPAGLETLHVHELPLPPSGDAARREQAALALNDLLHSNLERAGPFDFVYERYSLWSFAGMEYARAQRIPGLLEVNAPLIEEQAEHRILVDRQGAESVAARVFEAASALLAVSEEVSEYLTEKYPAARGRVQVIPNGVNPQRFCPQVHAACPGEPGSFTVGFVGTLKPWHGLMTLVEAFALLHDKISNTRLLVVGDGPERGRLEAELKGRGLAHTAHLTGSVAPAKMPGFLASMDAATAPYPLLAHFYFSPLKVYEYMAAGLAVVASRLGQLTKLIRDGDNGLLCTPGDAADLATALSRLRADPALRRRLGQAARADIIREHTWEAVVRRIIRLAQPPGQATLAVRCTTHSGGEELHDAKAHTGV
jgi:glycosyltransferase involved in cell wall biosynthesis